MNTSVNTDDVIFNFFKQICDEKNDQKCVELGNEWIKAMETNLSEMEKNLNGADYIKYKEDIQSNRNHLNFSPFQTNWFPLRLSILFQAGRIFHHFFHHKFV